MFSYVIFKLNFGGGGGAGSPDFSFTSIYYYRALAQTLQAQN